MSYLTKQDLIDRIGLDELIVLSDREHTGTEDDTVIDRAMADATTEIDMYLGVRYTLPLSTIPSTLTRLAVSIAVYWLSENEANISDLTRERYENAIKVLKGIAGGTIDLGVIDTDAPDTDGSGKVTLVSGERIFTRNTLGGLR